MKYLEHIVDKYTIIDKKYKKYSFFNSLDIICRFLSPRNCMDFKYSIKNNSLKDTMLKV